MVFNYHAGESFREWMAGSSIDENAICAVDTAQAALSLVSCGIGIACIPASCLQEYPGVQFVPLHNWHQALYMCILYDKWLEPPIWDFVEMLVKTVRSAASSDQ